MVMIHEHVEISVKEEKKKPTKLSEKKNQMRK